MEYKFFHFDEVAMMRFMTMCHESCNPEMFEAFKKLCCQLIDRRPGLRNDCFEIIEDYLNRSR